MALIANVNVNVNRDVDIDVVDIDVDVDGDSAAEKDSLFGWSLSSFFLRSEMV